MHACPSRPFPTTPAPAWHVSQLTTDPRAPPGSVFVVPQACWCWARRFWGWGGRGVCPGGLAESGSWQPEDAGWGQGRQHSGRKRSLAQGDVSKQDSRQGWTEAGPVLGRLESGRQLAGLGVGPPWPSRIPGETAGLS